MNAVCVVTALSAVSCEATPSTVNRHHNEGQTRIELVTLVIETDMVLGERGVFPPTEDLAYARWIVWDNEDILQTGGVRVDETSGLIIDAWGKPIRLIVESGILVGLGSSGMDERWDGGEGDDIVIRFEEYGVIAGPPGTPVPEAGTRETEELGELRGQ